MNNFDKLLAQNPKPLGPVGSGPGFGPLNVITSAVGAATAMTKVISMVIGTITVGAGIFFMFQFLLGAFGWLGASGDKARLEKAQHRITQAFLGLLIVVATYAITGIVGAVTGLDILLNEPCELINALTLGAEGC